MAARLSSLAPWTPPGPGSRDGGMPGTPASHREEVQECRATKGRGEQLCRQPSFSPQEGRGHLCYNAKVTWGDGRRSACGRGDAPPDALATSPVTRASLLSYVTEEAGGLAAARTPRAMGAWQPPGPPPTRNDPRAVLQGRVGRRKGFSSTRNVSKITTWETSCGGIGSV